MSMRRSKRRTQGLVAWDPGAPGATSKAAERVPLWMSRLRSQKLMEAVRGYEDFPILLETWRTCLQDEFDLPNLRQVLQGLESGSIRWSEVYCQRPSPMARAAPSSGCWQRKASAMQPARDRQLVTTGPRPPLPHKSP